MLFMAHIAGASVPSPAAQTGPTASADAVTALTLEAQQNVRLGHVAVLHGHVTPEGARDIEIQVGGDTVDARSGADGDFTARWKPSHAGEYVAHAGLGGGTAG